MASGDSLISWGGQAAAPPASSYAVPVIRNGRFLWSFVDGSDTSIDFHGVMPRHYASGGLTCRIGWLAATATAGTCRWAAAFERHDDEGTDLDSDSFAAAQTAGGTAPGTNGAIQYTDIAFTNSQIDGLAVGESFRLRVTRDGDGTSGTDSLADTAQLMSVELRET